MFIVINIIVLGLLLQADKMKGTDKMSLSCMLRIFCIIMSHKQKDSFGHAY